MVELLNIFSKKKVKKIEKIKIIADYREKSSLVISKLIEEGLDVELKELKVADYLVNGVAIERKTVSDFISSMLNGRLLRQLEEIQQYDSRLLIIEGIEEQELYSDKKEKNIFQSEYSEEIDKLDFDQIKKRVLSPNSVRGFLLSIVLRHKVPIMFTKDAGDTAKFIALIAKKEKGESPLNVRKKSLNKKEQLQFIAESFPGIGPKTARKLLEKFKTLKNIVNAPIEELTELIGKKADVFRLLEEEY